MNNSITLEYEEYITIIKALEYLAYKWEPYVDCDEMLTGQNRTQTRGSGYFEQKDYTDAINQAAAKLGNLIRNRKLKLCQKELFPVISNSKNITNSSFIIHPDSYRANNISYTISRGDIMDNAKIASVQIKFMKIDKNDSIPSYIDAQSITYMTTMENNCYYIPVCIIDYGFSKFMYPDWKGIIKFSELEQYEEAKAEKRGRHQKISDIKFAIFFLELISKGQILTKNDVNKERKEIYGKVLDASKEKFKDPTLNYKYISEKTKPYLDVFEGKYIEIYNR